MVGICQWCTQLLLLKPIEKPMIFVNVHLLITYTIIGLYIYIYIDIYIYIWYNIKDIILYIYYIYIYIIVYRISIRLYPPIMMVYFIPLFLSAKSPVPHIFVKINHIAKSWPWHRVPAHEFSISFSGDFHGIFSKKRPSNHLMWNPHVGWLHQVTSLYCVQWDPMRSQLYEL